MKPVFSTAYLPPILYFSKLAEHPAILIEKHEHFPKQTYRNRCVIYSPNGALNLSIPLIKRSERTLTKDIRICYDYNWQTIHFRSLESAYRSSPYFEFYEADLRPYFEKKHEFLIDLNHDLLLFLLRQLKMSVEIGYTDSYQKDHEIDYRNVISPKAALAADFAGTAYTQVFGSRHGFIPNLSIIDLLFNEGPKAKDHF